MKNPDAPKSKGSKKKPTSKVTSKTPSKRKKTRRDDDDEGDEEDGDGDTRPGKRAKKPMSTRGKGKDQDDDDDDGDDDDDDDLPITKKVVPELLLANKWDIENGPDPSGWWISEKLDGVRFAGQFQLPPTVLCNLSA
jgi:DNA ligase-1